MHYRFHGAIMVVVLIALAPRAPTGGFLLVRFGGKAMAVFRVNKNKNYTVMSNYHLRDKNLSLKAKGLLSLMLSLPEDWDYTIAGLCSISKENKTAIRSTLLELKERGYLKITKLLPNQTDSGRIEYIYDIYEENLDVEKQGIENLYLENVTQINKEKQNTKILNKDNITISKDIEKTPENYGNEEINKLFEEWENLCGFKVDSKVKANRFACYRLIKKRGFDSVLKAIPYVAESQLDQYAPRIVNFMDLEEKWNGLGVWCKKKKTTDFMQYGKIEI